MQFKITIITGILFLLINSLSIANPISQAETALQKNEQTQKKKPHFIQRIILKKISKKIKGAKEPASPLSKVALGLGISALPLIAAYGIGFLLGLAALITGIMALKRDYKNKKSRDFGMIGIVLGAITLVLLIVLLPIIAYSISEANFFN